MKIRVLSCLVLLAAISHAPVADAENAYLYGGSLPIPPIPPAHPPMADAPMPNRDTAEPFDPTPRSRLTLDTDINHRDAPAPGSGFAPGALYKLDNDRRFFVLPGLMMHIPLP